MSDVPRADIAPTYDADPPTHDGLPLIGNTHQLVREQGGFYEAAAEHGDVDLSVSITTRSLDPIEARVEPRARDRA